MSSERSGSNLLRTLLSNHTRIAAPVAPQLLPTFAGLAPYYGSLAEIDPAIALLRDMLALINHPYYNWDLRLDPVSAVKESHPQTFLDLFHLLHTEKRRITGKSRYLCKANKLYNHALALRDRFPDSQFIYLYRDPRDYALSFIRTPHGPKTPYDAARLWVHEQNQWDILLHTYGLPAHPVSYESLIANPAAAITGILNYLKEPIEAHCFQVQPEKNEQLSWNVYWRNLARPVLASNAGKYKQAFNRGTINMIETLTKNHLIRLGYTLDTPADWQRPRAFRLSNYLTAWWNRNKTARRSPKTTTSLASRNALIASITASRTNVGRDYRREAVLQPATQEDLHQEIAKSP